MNIVKKRKKEQKREKHTKPIKQVKYINWKKREKGGSTWILGIGSDQSGGH